ncbi:hypothetical protein KY359_06735 [Candidatus Woesearchaeota archaeon]|nr:hypothetical protein [Candidatus Woesearchaeota archaeon]
MVAILEELAHAFSQGEFCNNVSCPVYREMNRRGPESHAYAGFQNTCRNRCWYEAADFYDWAVRKGYNANDILLLKNTTGVAETDSFSQLMRWMDEHGIELFKPEDT